VVAILDSTEVDFCVRSTSGPLLD